MAVFRSLHNGENIRALKGIIKYNSVNKKGFNSKINPRLIAVHSNVGDCDDVNDQADYKQLTKNFILSIEANSSLSTNSRQKYLYEHSIISFEELDDENLGMDKITELALKITNQANPNGAPFMLWPQIDSGKLHFHLVRGLHDENGNYQKKSNDYNKTNKFIQKLEVEENLVLTGKNNPDNYIWKTKNGKPFKTYFPGSNQDQDKIDKNKKIDTKIKINNEGRIKYIKKLNGKVINVEALRDKKEKKKEKVRLATSNNISKIVQENNELSQPIEYSTLQKIKNSFQKTFFEIHTTQEYLDRKILDEKIKKNKKTLGLVQKKTKTFIEMIDSDLVEIENNLTKLDVEIEKKENEIESECKKLRDEAAKNKQFKDFRDLVNKTYKNTGNAQDFLKILNENNIEVAISYRANGQGGISFNSLENQDISMAGGRVNSYLTFGKIKKNDPQLFSLLTGSGGFGEIALTNEKSLKVVNFNKNYKEKINEDGSISIFFHKKNADKYPHNHNLKINADKNKISFGQFSNDYDIKLAYELAKSNDWSNAESNNKELILKSMAIAYKENKDDLFFFQTKEPTLKVEDIKKIVGDDLISKDNLIKLYDQNLFDKSDEKEVVAFIKNQLHEQKEDITTINTMLKNGHSLKECIEENERKTKEREIKKLEKRETIKKAVNTETTRKTAEKRNSPFNVSSPFDRPKPR